MSGQLYNLEFSGRIIAGWNMDEVKANLAKLLGADEETIYRLFSGKRFIIKKNIDHQSVIKINKTLKEAGVDCVITPVPGSGEKAPPPLPPKSGPGQTIDKPAAADKPEMGAADIHPKRFWYVVAILLFFVPMIAGGITIFNTFTSYFSESTRLAVPGETEIDVTEPGTYFILYETRIFTGFNFSDYKLGRDYSIDIMDLATGEELRLKPASFPGTEEVGTIVRQPIAEVQFNTIGPYGVEVAGEIPEADGLLLRRFDLPRLIKGVVWAILLFFLGFIAGPVMALVVLVKRQNHKRIHRDEPITENEERQWAMFAHIGTFCSMIVPLGNFIAPVVIWQIKKKDSAFVVDQAKESLNFQITLMIYALISIVLAFIIIGFFLLFGLVIFSLIFIIIAGVKANDGEHYRYPLCIRLVK